MLGYTYGHMRVHMLPSLDAHMAICGRTYMAISGCAWPHEGCVRARGRRRPGTGPRSKRRTAARFVSTWLARRRRDRRRRPPWPPRLIPRRQTRRAAAACAGIAP
eukprot:6785958-Prymnesium_polylepis.1